MALGRWIRHAFTMPIAVRRAFSEESLARIEQAITASEQTHTGEIRFAIEASLPWSYLRRDAPTRQRATMVFSKLRVWDTEHNNGVLIYVELADRSIEIVADRGVTRHVQQAEWDAVCATMREQFRAGRFEQGALDAIEAVGTLLTRHFPIAEGGQRSDELPDRPAILS